MSDGIPQAVTEFFQDPDVKGMLEAFQQEDWIRDTIEAFKGAGFDKVHREDIHDDTTITVACSQCQVAIVQGVPCHEHGCPNLKCAQDRILAEFEEELV